MTSPGLKRTLDYELTPHQSGPSGLNTNGPVANGTKRRDPSAFLNSINDDIASLIQDEMQAAHENNSKDYEPLVLTVRQTQSICEKLVKDREQKLRDEYDRILACKLAEQYDHITKANYINPYMDPFIPRPNRPNISPNDPLAAGVVAMLRSSAGALSSPQQDLTTLAATLSANGLPGASGNPHLAYNIQQQAAAAGLQAQQRAVAGGTNVINMGPVLLTSNLDEQLATPEALFTLFGVFGDVIRVKILFNKKDNALIQMADANQAQVAQGYLDKQKIFGKVIRVTRSKHQIVQMPREVNQSDAGLTKDFTNSPLHRFKIPGSRNCLNIYPPSNTLHISNIPPTIEESDINRAFKEACNFEFTSFKFFPKDRKMALVKFDSIEQATIALIKMHNYPISEENNLRVSFSKSIM